MDAIVDSEYDLLQWPASTLLAASVAFGLGYLLYGFGYAPPLLGVFARTEVTFLFGQFSVALFAAYLVVVFVTGPIHDGAVPTAAGAAAADDSLSASQANDDTLETAMTQLTQPLDDHLSMLCAWYVAAHPAPPAEPPASYTALFDDEFAEVVRRLDFSTDYEPGGVTDPTWLAWSVVGLAEFRRETMAVLDVHSESLTPDTAAQLHTLSNSRLTKRVLTADEADLLGHIPATAALLLFSNDGDTADDTDPLAAHLDTLQEVLALHERHSSRPLTPIENRDCWATDQLPTHGIARAAADNDDERYYKLI